VDNDDQVGGSVEIDPEVGTADATQLQTA